MAAAVIAVSMWEEIAAFILAVGLLTGQAWYWNSQRKVDFWGKIIIYGVLGVVWVIMDLAAVQSIINVGWQHAFLELQLVTTCVILVGLTIFWERKRGQKTKVR